MLEEDRERENLWEKVDDFKWLRNEQSPNWSLLEPEARVEERFWKEVVPGGPSLGVDDVLKAVGVSRS
jgi:hypothetical protein